MKAITELKGSPYIAGSILKEDGIFFILTRVPSGTGLQDEQEPAFFPLKQLQHLSSASPFPHRCCGVTPAGTRSLKAKIP